MTTTKRLLVAAGGTGGHIFPALAVADSLRQQGVEILWLGTRQRMEAQIIPQQGYELRFLEITGLRGKGTLALLRAPWRLLKAIYQAWRVLKSYQPQAVLTMGGFVCGPVGIAAWLRRIPLLVHEQNAVVGLTNRLLYPFACRTMAAFPGAWPEQKKVQLTGNPMRAALLALPPVRQRFTQRQGPLRILVLGGSQGCALFNERIPQALAAWPVALSIRHQAGQAGLLQAQQAYQQAEVQAEILPFIDEMAEAYGWADLVISRSGALTVTELATVGLPALFVPYPAAVDDHQAMNADYLVQAGAAQWLRQADCSVEQLRQKLLELLTDRSHLMTKAEKAAALSHQQATAMVAQTCWEIINHA